MATTAEESLERRRAVFAGHSGPKSICECGHLGDGEGSSHAGAIGHGACTAPSCKCTRFTWVDWSLDFKRKLDAA